MKKDKNKHAAPHKPDAEDAAIVKELIEGIGEKKTVNELANEACRRIHQSWKPAKQSRKTMTLNLTQREMKALENMAKDKGMSKTQIMRMALRLYQSTEYPIDPELLRL